MKIGRLVLWLVVIAALVALVAWALRPQPVSVETAEVARGAFEQTIDDDGRTRVHDRYVVSAPLAGRVLRLGLRVGDEVAEGAVVATLLPSAPALLDQRTVRELEERLAAAQAGVLRAVAMEERAKAAHDQARADAARAEKLAAAGFVAPSAREQAELAVRLRDRELEAARYEKNAAEREAAQARAALLRVRSEARGEVRPGGGFEIRAPVSGRVLKVLQESEAVVAVGAGLVELGDIARLEVVVDVLSSDAVTIPPGAAVHIDAGPGKDRLEGRVRRIEPAAFTKISALGVEEQRVNVVIDLVSPPAQWQALGDGYRVDARIVIHRSPDAVKVPSAALFRDGGAYAVYVVEAGVARKRTVEVPRRNDREALVEKGIAPGERVIVFPGDAVRDGVKVALRS